MHRLTRHRRSRISIVALLLAIVLLLAACDDDKDDAQGKETSTGQSAYEKLVARQPAHDMTYSPTRNTVNFFIDTWGKNPNKLSYVYLQNANGDLLGFYTLRGLPVNYCVSLRPNYKIEKTEIPGDNTAVLSVPAPSADGVYYGPGAGCSTYYGRDVNGDYIEYTVGLGINVLLYDQPLPNRPNVPSLSPAKK